MVKSKETYKKVADTFQEKGDKAWAKAKNGEGDHLYSTARSAYNTAEKARKKSK